MEIKFTWVLEVMSRKVTCNRVHISKNPRIWSHIKCAFDISLLGFFLKAY